MEFEEALVDLLKNDAAVSALIGDRIFPWYLPEGIIRPAVTYELDAVDRSPREHGGLVQAFLDFEIQVDGRDYGLSKQIADAIRIAIDTKKGTQTSGFDFRGVTLEDESNQHVPPSDGRGRGFSVHVMEFSIFYRESVLVC